jgi:hypothetical protein
MDLAELGFSQEETNRYQALVVKKMGSFQAQEEETGGEIEYKGIPYYPEFSDVEEVDFFSSTKEIDEYIAFQEKIEEAIISKN